MMPLLFTAIALTVLAAGPVFANGFELLRPAPAPEQNPQTQEKIELGKKLFFDKEKKYLKTFLIEALTGEDIVVSYPNVPQ